MDRNTGIGLGLILLLFVAWQYMLAPSKEQIAMQKRTQDSIARLEKRRDSLASLKKNPTKVEVNPSKLPDSTSMIRLGKTAGAFAPAAYGKEEEVTLENELLKVTFSTRGARIVDVLLKTHYKMVHGKDRKDRKFPLHLLNDPRDQFEYGLPVKGVDGDVGTASLYFTPEKKGNSIVFTAKTSNGGALTQTFTLPGNSYKLDYQLGFDKLDEVLNLRDKSMPLYWTVFLDKIEKATQYERTYSSLNFKPVAERSARCSPTRQLSEKDAEGQPIQWVANTNQFFNSALLAEKGFSSAKMKSINLADTETSLKELSTVMQVPMTGNGTFDMQFYIGPNQFDILRKMGYDMSDIVPFGNNIMGTINRWVIRPVFNFLSNIFSSKGLVIFLLTLLVKLCLFPLTYRMIYSQSKMSALKPEIDKLKEKHKDEQQQVQVETMKMYREFGVNPLGACFPMLLQLPIWFALYRFFPASIEFRQKGFWWTQDLSSYDEFFQLPFSVPFGFGDHVSLFALLWVLSTLVYTWYNSRNMDFSANPAMLYMQYIMPVLFMGFFNSSASGLSAYMFFSNLLNIGQTLATKYLLIDEKKIKAEMDAYKKKPKKKGGFGERMEQMMKDQQRLAEERAKQAGKKK